MIWTSNPTFRYVHDTIIITAISHNVTIRRFISHKIASTRITIVHTPTNIPRSIFIKELFMYHLEISCIG